MFLRMLRRHPFGEVAFVVEWKSNTYPPLHGLFWSKVNIAENGCWPIEALVLQNPLAATVDQQWCGLRCSSFRTFKPSGHWHKTFGMQQNALTDGCAWCLQLDNPKP